MDVVQGHYFFLKRTSLFTLTSLHNGRWHRNFHYSTWLNQDPPVLVQCIAINITFYSPHLKMMLQIVYFDLHIHATHKKHLLIAHQSLAGEILNTAFGMLSFRSSSEKGLLLYSLSLNTFTAKVDLGRFKYLHFNLPASTLVDLKFTLLFCLK
jgi:hypothetical protein